CCSRAMQVWGKLLLRWVMGQRRHSTAPLRGSLTVPQHVSANVVPPLSESSRLNKGNQQGPRKERPHAGVAALRRLAVLSDLCGSNQPPRTRESDMDEAAGWKFRQPLFAGVHRRTPITPIGSPTFVQQTRQRYRRQQLRLCFIRRLLFSTSIHTFTSDKR